MDEFERVLSSYWSIPVIQANVVIVLNLLGAFALGLIVGYERAFHGRAAGTRTYGLVCLAACALVVLAGHPEAWFGGHVSPLIPADPTRVIQGIVTGVGFLGAGVIVKEDYNISGLTTAASIWSSSAIGILVGVGFYLAAMVLTACSAGCMMWMYKVERHLPSHEAVMVVVKFLPGFVPDEKRMRDYQRERGFEFVGTTLSVRFAAGVHEWRFVVISKSQDTNLSMADMSAAMSTWEGVDSFQVARAKN